MVESFNEKHNKLIHTSFEIGLTIKGVYALLEIISGILLIYLSPDLLNRFINFITHGELMEDPKDFIANMLLRLSSGFLLNQQSFLIFYLISHGIIKFVIILLLWRKKLWAYPLSVAVFCIFILYQIYKYLINSSIWMILLSLLDIIMIILTLMEYQNIKRSLKPQDNSNPV